MTHPILRVEDLTIAYGGVVAVKDLSFSLEKGERVGLIGPNGAGKTSVVNALSGFYLQYKGKISLNGEDITKLHSFQRVHCGLARSFQSAKLFSSRTVEENIAAVRKFAKSDAAVDLVELNPELHARLYERAGSLPYGLQKQLGCLLAYIAARHVLLLDEPAAGLAVSEREFVDRIVEHAVSRNYAVLLIEHDMDMIKRTCDRTIVLANGTLLAQGKTDEVLQRHDVIETYLGKEV
jgi:branched-chain amino acid transport system ATP-binding protein